MIDPRALPFATAGCEGAKEHRPLPLITELHHEFPVYLQARVWDDVDPTRPGTAHVQTKRKLCGNCHASVHVVLEALIQGKQPPKVGAKILAIARAGYQDYVKAAAKP